MLQRLSELEGLKFNKELMEELAVLYNYNMDGTPKTKASDAKPAEAESKEASLLAEPVLEELATEPWTDQRTFFQKYTPANILAEIRYRLSKPN